MAHGTVDLWPYYNALGIDLISACDLDSGVFVLEFTGASGGCVSGFTKSAADQSLVGGAWVYSQQADRRGVSNENGYYELKTAQDLHTVTASALGFSPTEANIDIFTRSCLDCQHDFSLDPNTSNLATAWNNGRKVVVDSAHCFHLVYQNITHPHGHDPPTAQPHSVIYGYSTDRGVSWEFTEFEDAYYPSLAVEAAGQLHNFPHIVFVKHGASPQLDESLVHYWRDEDGQWQLETLRGPYDGYDRLFRPAIAAEPGIYDPPKLHVVWAEVYPRTPPTTSINYWNPQTGVEEVASADNKHSLEYSTIAVDGAGTPHVLWQDNTDPDPDRHKIFHSYRDGGWGAQSQLVAEYAEHPCADEWGNGIYAVWEQGTIPEIFLGTLMGTTWYTNRISQTLASSEFPALDDLNIVWSEESPDPGHYEVFYSKYYPPNNPTGPENLSETPFTSSLHPQVLYHNFGTWRPSCDRFYVTWTEDLVSHQRLVFKDRVPAEP